MLVVFGTCVFAIFAQISHLTNVTTIMRFTVSSGELFQNLQTVAKVINPKSVSVVPVLGNILFEIEGNMLTLTAADLNIRISSKIEIQNQGGNGSFIAPDKILLESFKELPDQPVEFSLEEESYKATVHYQKGHFSLLASASENYPIATELEAGDLTHLELDARGMLEALNSTQHIASTDEKRPILTGVLLDIYTDQLVYVATDSRKLVRYIDRRVTSSKEASACLPNRVCTLLSRTLLGKESGNVHISFDGKQFFIQGENFQLSTRLLEGKYPNYNSVIPSDSPYHITVEKNDLLFAAKRVSVFSNRASKLILFDVNPSHIRIAANDLELSVAAEEQIASQSNDPAVGLYIGFDFDALQATLQCIQSEQVTFQMADQTRVNVVTGVQTNEHVEVCCLLSPVRIVGE